MTRTQTFDALHNKDYVYDGVHGTLKRRWYMATNGRYEARLLHEPSVFGRVTQRYSDYGKLLGDDWVMDLTDDPEVYLGILHDLGIKDPTATS